MMVINGSVVMRLALVLLAAALVVAGCSNGGDGSSTANRLDAEDTTAATVPAAGPDRSALPPRHLDVEEFPEALVDRQLIVSGGPPPDGIPSIDTPTFSSVDAVDWLDDDEAVLFLDVDGVFRVYPTQIMVWHEIVNDDVDGRPVAVTYCPLCNSGLAFDRRALVASGEEIILDFGTSGSLYQSAMIMYDRQTESLWTHFDGRAVVGDLIGTELVRLPLGVASWSEVRDAQPNAQVLERPASGREYGRNPYVGYDQSGYPIEAFFSGEVDERAEPMSRVIGFEVGEQTTAVTLDRVASDGVVELEIDGEPIVVWHVPGLVSSLEASTIAGGSDIGAVAAFATSESFSRTADGVVDEATSSTWNVLGTAVSGPREGEQLPIAAKIDTFWFAWSTYHPATTLVD